MTYPFFDRKERVPQETPALTLHNHTAVSGSHRVAQTHLRKQELLAAHFRDFMMFLMLIKSLKQWATMSEPQHLWIVPQRASNRPTPATPILRLRRSNKLRLLYFYKLRYW